MTTQSAFSVAVRTVGLLLVLWGLHGLYMILATLPFLAFPQPLRSAFGMLEPVLEVLLGLYLMRGAHGVVRWCFAPPALS